MAGAPPPPVPTFDVGAGAGGFTFPTMYSWPPFFTLQTNAASRAKQYEAWSSLIREYCRFHKRFVLDVAEEARSPLFSNAAIGRALPAASIVQLLDQLAEEGFAEWLGPGAGRGLVAPGGFGKAYPSHSAASYPPPQGSLSNV